LHTRGGGGGGGGGGGQDTYSLACGPKYTTTGIHHMSPSVGGVALDWRVYR
jgi:hypothetical protein